jgi:hypothetical protein
MKHSKTARHFSIPSAFLIVGGCAMVSAFTAPFAERPALSGDRVAAPASRWAPAGASLFEPDKGRFRILVNGQQVGKEEYEIAASNNKWIARGATDLQSAQTSTHVTGALELQPDGTPVRYEWSTQGAKKASAAVNFQGLTATIELHLDNRQPYTQQFTFNSARIAVLDNNLNYQYAVLARLYDWTKKGAQTFPVLVPQELTPGTATVESLGKQDAEGKSLEKLRVKTEDNEIDLYLEGPRLVRISVPSANAEIIRE